MSDDTSRVLKVGNERERASGSEGSGQKTCPIRPAPSEGVEVMITAPSSDVMVGTTRPDPMGR